MTGATWSEVVGDAVAVCQELSRRALAGVLHAGDLRALLQSLETVADASMVPLADRSHRLSFPRNYRSLYHSAAKRDYRCDVLASGMHNEPLHVNGRLLPLPGALLQVAEVLRHAWSCVLHLGFVNPAEGSQAATTQGAVLKYFDQCYARFERDYISFLSIVEKESKKLVHVCRELAAVLTQGGPGVDWTFGPGVNMQAVTAVERSLAEAVAALNGVANAHGTGRSDLHLEILTAARAGLASGSGLALCSRVVSAWYTLVAYFASLDPGLDLLDPQLSQNEELVRHLAEYEASWDAGRAYLTDPAKHTALVAWLQDLRGLGEAVPAFGEALGNADVEACWRLPQLFSAFCGRPEGAALLALLPGAVATPLGDYASVTRRVAAGADVPELVAAGLQASRSDPPRWNELLALVVGELER